MGMFEITNNRIPEVEDELDRKTEAALTAVGIRGEERAKKICTRNHSVDTGLMRNSITFALDGKEPNVKVYKADRGDGTGAYAGAMPKEPDDNRCVYIGTNVEYAPFVEKGTSRMKTPKPFLRPAVEGGASDFQKIIKRYLEGE